MNEYRIKEQLELPGFEEEEWLFTWGWGQEFPNRFLRLKGTKSSTRQQMVDRFGGRWSFQYAADKEPSLLFCGITEITEEELAEHGY